VSDDAANFAAMTAWVAGNNNELERRGIAVLLDGPFEALGMDPVYILKLESSEGEAEACLFRGGTQLMAHLDKASLEVWQGHVDATRPSEISAALDGLAERM